LEDNPNMDAEGAQPGVKNPKPWLQFPTPTFFKELNLPPRQEKPLPPSEGPEKRPLYLEHEWPEEAEWSSKVDNKLKEITTSNCTRCPFTEAELKASPVEYTQDEARALEQSVPKQFDSEIIQDKDGHLLGVFLSDGLKWPWNTENGTTLAKIPLQATMDLVDAYPAPMPKTDDVRHVNPVDERKRLEQQGQPHGIYHTGLIRYV